MSSPFPFSVLLLYLLEAGLVILPLVILLIFARGFLLLGISGFWKADELILAEGLDFIKSLIQTMAASLRFNSALPGGRVSSVQTVEGSRNPPTISTVISSRGGCTGQVLILGKRLDGIRSVSLRSGVQAVEGRIVQKCPSNLLVSFRTDDGIAIDGLLVAELEGDPILCALSSRPSLATA